MLRASLPSSGRLSVRPSVRLSVRLSHSWSVSKRCKLGSRNLHCGVGCPKVSSLSWQNFVPLGAGVPLERGRPRGVPPKKDVILPLLARIMWKRLQIGAYMLLIITSTGDRLFGFINIDDLERPWTPQKGFYWIFPNFWMQRTFQHWIATKWLAIDQDNLRMKFSAFNVDCSGSSSDSLGLRRPRRASKTAIPLKSGYFTAIISCSVNTVADRHRHVAYHNKHWWQAFLIYQHRWPWTTLNPSKKGF